MSAIPIHGPEERWRRTVDQRGQPLKLKVERLLREFGYTQLAPGVGEAIESRLAQVGLHVRPALRSVTADQMILLELTAGGGPSSLSAPAPSRLDPIDEMGQSLLVRAAVEAERRVRNAYDRAASAAADRIGGLERELAAEREATARARDERDELERRMHIERREAAARLQALSAAERTARGLLEAQRTELSNLTQTVRVTTAAIAQTRETLGDVHEQVRQTAVDVREALVDNVITDDESPPPTPYPIGELPAEPAPPVARGSAPDRTSRPAPPHPDAGADPDPDADPDADAGADTDADADTYARDANDANDANDERGGERGELAPDATDAAGPTAGDTMAFDPIEDAEPPAQQSLDDLDDRGPLGRITRRGRADGPPERTRPRRRGRRDSQDERTSQSSTGKATDETQEPEAQRSRSRPRAGGPDDPTRDRPRALTDEPQRDGSHRRADAREEPDRDRNHGRTDATDEPQRDRKRGRADATDEPQRARNRGRTDEPEGREPGRTGRGRGERRRRPDAFGCAVCGRPGKTRDPVELVNAGWRVEGEVALCLTCVADDWKLTEGDTVPFRSRG